MARSIPPVPVVLLILSGVFLVPTALRGGQYGETFSSYAVGTSSFSQATGELFSNQAGTTAAVKDATVKELRLTELDTPGTFSAFRLPDLDAGSVVTAFSAKWNSQIYGDAVFDGMADGFSLNFGPLGGSPTKFTDGSFPAESGYGAGLTVGVATYYGGSPGYSVRVNGETVPGGFVGKADYEWGDFNSARHFFEVDWNYFSGLTLRVDGVAIFTNLPTPGYVPVAGNRFVLGARTGSVTSEMSVDNIVIVTGGTLAAVSLPAPYYYSGENPPDETADKAFDGSNETKWLASFFPQAHIGAGLTGAKTLRAYALTSANDAEERDPEDWTFETSNDGSNWSSRSGQAGEGFVNRFEQRAFLVTSPAADTGMRLNISTNRSGPYVQLAELRAWDLVPGPAMLTVTNAADSGAGSLRAALATAAGAAGPAYIIFAPGLAGSTISLASEMVISDAEGVAIDAGGLAGGIILNGGNARRIMSNSGAGPVNISGITFSAGNAVSSFGGAFLANTGSNTGFSGCSFTGNSADYGGAVYGFGTLAWSDCTFSGNTATVGNGGGINPRGNAVMTRCTLQGNSAFYGGAIENNGQLSLVHCTITGNTADAAGGGVDNFNGNVTLANTIIGGNTVNSQPDDFFQESLSSSSATLTRVGANILRTFASAGPNSTVAGPVPSTGDPLLAPLADYGGPTRTMALKPGSPARDASVSSSAKVDQRGVAVSGVPDIGAYEAFVSTSSNYEAWIVEGLPASASPASYAAGVDYDGDGWTNKNEWEAYTDPANASSYLKVTTLGLQGEHFLVRYTSLQGRNYTLQYSYDLVTWTSIAPYAGTGTTITLGLGPVTGIKTFFVRVHPGF